MTATSDSRWRPALSHRGPIPALAARLDAVPLPRAPSPMLCTLVAEPFNSKDWIFEPKYDGLRVLGVFDGQKLTLLSRNHQPQNLAFPDIVAALQASLRYPALVDGEVVCFDALGRTNFNTLQQRFNLKDAGEVQERMQQYPAYLYLFDLLYVDHFDVSRLPLDKRKELLREAVDWSEHVRWTPFQEGDGIRLWRQACREQSEGIVGKLRSSRYVQGRSAAWVKVKCLGKQEFVIAGFTDPQRSRAGLGALLVGYYSDDGKRLLYAGKVGTGFTDETLRDLREQLDLLEQSAAPFDRADVPREEHVHWVKPRLVAAITFSEWTPNGLLRQPRFEGLRLAKRPKECRRERPQHGPPAPLLGHNNHHTAGASDSAEGSVRRPQRKPSKLDVAEAPAAPAVAFTHTDKVWFPDAGLTKADVLAFYERIAPRLLPYLRDRPLTLERLPEGVGDKDRPHFWQKNTPASYPDWIPRVELPTERGKSVHYVLVNDRRSLLYLVNQGTLTFHTWLSRVADLDRPDFVLFDLDPGEAAFAEVVAVARELHDLLKGARRKVYVKTSGKTGLHLLVPWRQEGGYDASRSWAHGVAERLAEALPDRATVEVRKARRGGRVYVDTLQNARGHHVVPPYVLRAVPGATISTPLHWKEVTAELDPGKYSLTTIFRRLARQKQDPLAPLARAFARARQPASTQA